MSANSPAPLVDRTALGRFRNRTSPDAMFLHREAQDEIKDRLSMVNKAFTSCAIVTGHPELWADVIPDAQISADTDTLDLPLATFDLVVHAMCLHWANDPVGQLIQCRRAMKPDGLLLAILPGGQTLNELRSCISEAETTLRGGLSPRILPMGDIRDLGALLQRAGFALPVADSLDLNAEYDDLLALMKDLRGMGETNALQARDRHLTRKSLFVHASQLYVEHFAGTQKPIRASFELVTLTGWAPDESQQKPLRPGSAKSRLSDALNVDETSLRD